MQVQNKKSYEKDTETLILEAAEDEFMAKGFLGARTTSIASAAGVTHAMLHYYFRTKENLFERIMENKIALLKEAILGSSLKLDASLDEIIKNIISNHLDFIAANPDLPRFIVGEIYSDPARASIFLDKLKEYAPPFIAFLQGKIDNEAAKGNCRRVDARTVMLDIVSLNIFPYMAAPAVNAALGDCLRDPERFLSERKKENYETIIRKLTV